MGGGQGRVGEKGGRQRVKRKETLKGEVMLHSLLTMMKCDPLDDSFQGLVTL